MADKLEDVLSPEGRNPINGEQVDAGRTVSYAKGAAMIAAAGAVGFGIFNFARNQVRSFTGNEGGLNVPTVGDL